MSKKDDIAQVLAKAHRKELSTITRIVRLCGPNESADNEPIKLLEVNPDTAPSGIWPIALIPDPPDIPYGSVVVEVTPDEYNDILANRLPLPHGWTLGDTLLSIEP